LAPPRRRTRRRWRPCPATGRGPHGILDAELVGPGLPGGVEVPEEADARAGASGVAGDEQQDELAVGASVQRPPLGLALRRQNALELAHVEVRHLGSFRGWGRTAGAGASGRRPRPGPPRAGASSTAGSGRRSRARFVARRPRRGRRAPRWPWSRGGGAA